MSRNIESNSRDDLIGNLTEDLQPISPMAHPFYRLLPWAALSFGYVALVIGIIGIRGDIGTKANDPLFLYEIILALATALSAACASAWLCVPDMRGAKWLLAVPFSLFAVFVGWLATRIIGEPFVMPAIDLHHCLGEAFLMIFVPVTGLILLSRKGATTRPVMMGALNAIAVGGLGFAGLRLICPVDNMGHICIYHVMPFLLLGLIIGLAARRLYRW